MLSMTKRMWVFASVVGWIAACGNDPSLAPATATPMLSSGARAIPKYSLKPLPNEGGLANAGGITTTGLVGGVASLPGDLADHAAIWNHFQLSDVGTLSGGPRASLTNTNHISWFSGSSQIATADPYHEDFCQFFPPPDDVYQYLCHGIVWQSEVNRMVDLPPLPGGLNSSALGPNQNRIAGFAENGVRDPSCAAPQVFDFEAVLWRISPSGVASIAARLPPLPGDTVSIAAYVNRQGDVVGTSGSCGSLYLPASTKHIVLWERGEQPKDLGSLGGTFNNFAFSINDKRQVVGLSNLAGDNLTHPFLWEKGNMIDMGLVRADDTAGWGNAINNEGEVVGASCGPSDCHGFYWKDDVLTDLNDVLSEPTALTIMSANDINSRGEIVAAAFDPNFGDQVAVVLFPVQAGDNGVGAASDQ
jgi:probable HAF family extracellular repeat protein